MLPSQKKRSVRSFLALNPHLPPALPTKSPTLSSSGAPPCCPLFSTCTAAAWKIGIVHLLGKKKAADDSTNPSHFRPIAFTSCVSKVFTNLVKRRWLSFMMSNNFLNTATQKAFIDGVIGCSEHHLKLLAILHEAQRKR